MTNDQLAPSINRGLFFIPGQSHGFGLLGVYAPKARARPAC
jgi:hypothetical protein